MDEQTRQCLLGHGAYEEDLEACERMMAACEDKGLSWAACQAIITGMGRHMIPKLAKIFEEETE